jgi:hypothetical protein
MYEHLSSEQNAMLFLGLISSRHKNEDFSPVPVISNAVHVARLTD